MTLLNSDFSCAVLKHHKCLVMQLLYFYSNLSNLPSLFRGHYYSQHTLVSVAFKRKGLLLTTLSQPFKIEHVTD